jgi:hypothetical protein
VSKTVVWSLLIGSTAVAVIWFAPGFRAVDAPAPGGATAVRAAPSFTAAPVVQAVPTPDRRKLRPVDDDEDLLDGDESSVSESVDRAEGPMMGVFGPQDDPDSPQSDRQILNEPGGGGVRVDPGGPAREDRDGTRRRLFGLRSTDAGLGLGGSAATQDELSSVDAPDSNSPRVDLTRVSGQARGYTMLYMMQPNARPVVEQQVTTLLRSNIAEIHIGVLIDETFGRDYDYMRSVLRRLSVADRAVFLTLYLVSGPTMRDFATTPLRTAFSTVSPALFRLLITSDRDVRNRFARIAREARVMFDFNRTLSPRSRNFAVVMLEDNLDRSSYRAMRALASAVLGPEINFVRNPCLGCFPGNDSETFGDALEEHSPQRFLDLGVGDAFSLDGLGFRHEGEGPENGVDLGQLEAFLDQGLTRGLAYFGLWRFSWQGIVPGRSLAHPDQRVYLPSTPDQEAVEIRLLRRGLIQGTPSPTPAG